MKLVILGAGAIGCWVGGAWAAGVRALGGQVTLLGPSHSNATLRNSALHLTGEDAPETVGEVAFHDNPDALAQAQVIALAVKSHALSDAIAQINAHAAPDAVVVSLLNGISPVRDLRAGCHGRDVIAGMVPFNVVWSGPSRLNRSGAGRIALERHAVTEALHRAGAVVDLHDDLAPIQHGKLLLNLANAVNALSGKPLNAMLSDRGYRRVFAASLAEALRVYDAGNVAWEQVGPNNPRLARKMLTAPDWLFRLAVLRKAGLDRGAMTSMAQDMQAGRPTEIDTINAEIIRLGALHGVATPVNQRIVDLIKSAEQAQNPPAFSAATLQAEVGL